MQIRIDFGDAIQKTVAVSTKFGDFWRGLTMPGDMGPAISFLLVMGLLPALGHLLSGIIPQPFLVPFGGVVWAWRPIYGILAAIVFYLVAIFAPVLMGTIMGALDPAFNLNKANAAGYTTVLAYCYGPAAVGSLFSFIPFIGWLVVMAAGIYSLVLLFIAFTDGLGIDIGYTIILIVIAALIVGVIIGVLMGLFFFFAMFIPFM